MVTSSRFCILSFVAVIAGCAPSAVTEEEIVPVYESPCDVYDAGASACGAPDENGSYVAAWSALPCMDVCDALDAIEPHPVIACGPVHPATGDDENAGFAVVTCTFDEGTVQ